MYTGLELAIIAYVLGFVIHVAFFRVFKGFYKFIDRTINAITPTTWCFIWPLAWAVFGIYYMVKTAFLCYCAVEYVVSGQWNFKKW